MKITKIVCAVAAASLSLSGIAYAQGNDANTERPMTTQRGGSERGAAQHHERSTMPVRQDHGRAAVARDERGAGPEHNFYRGGRLPTEYRGRQYVVDDWRGHHLSAPPRGYHWVQAGGDYVLVAIVSGVIASILLNSN